MDEIKQRRINPSRKTITDQANNTKNRSRVYGFLSRIYKKEPSQELLASFINPDFLRLLNDIGLDLGEYFGRASLEELSGELAIEYTRLLLGPGKHIHPCESAYTRREAGMPSNIAGQIKTLVESHGFRLEEGFHENYDHISVELEFMERLTDAEANALGEQDYEKAAKILKLEKEFLNEHLAKWVPQFSDAVIAQASLSFYREIAKLTKEYILQEVRRDV